jgi:D-3-phosphoglycerate dehydrogenase
MKKILISTSTFGVYDHQPVERLREAGYEVDLNPYKRKLTDEECLACYRDKIGVIAGTEVISRDLLRQADHLKIISRCGTGMDNVDIQAAKDQGIQVVNTPDGPTLAVAELTLGLVLCLLRRVHEMDRELRKGTWQKKMGNLLADKSVGIIGYGKIGQNVGELLGKIGCRIFFYDLKIRECNHGYKFLPFEEILKQSEIICLHVSGNFAGKPLVGKKEIGAMKPGAWLINCSRGGVVDEAALHHALRSNHLAGAAIDVFESEPYNGRLKELSNVILTPHIGSYAKEARIAMEMQAVENLIKGLNNAS